PCPAGMLPRTAPRRDARARRRAPADSGPAIPAVLPRNRAEMRASPPATQDRADCGAPTGPRARPAARARAPGPRSGRPAHRRGPATKDIFRAGGSPPADARFQAADRSSPPPRGAVNRSPPRPRATAAAVERSCPRAALSSARLLLDHVIHEIELSLFAYRAAMALPQLDDAVLIVLLAIDEHSGVKLTARCARHLGEHELVADEIHEGAALARRHDEDELQ